MLQPLTHDDPDEIAGHRLLARLGHGGMGTVYLARTGTGRVLALKTMHARIAADPAARTRFHLEADAARVIGSHHGAAVFDADPTATTPWLATEYVLGPPLDEAVALGGPLPEPSVRALGAALAGALGRLHASDVVHRDLKPSNVMITAHGPKIIDFGIARAAGDARLTSTGTAAGTPAFMSPEQASGLDHPPAGDVFALAGVLVFAATGHGPFGSGQAADLLYRVRYSAPDLTGLPAELLPVLTACLEKEPGARPTTDELTTLLHDGRGEFADHLPDSVLADIGRRATAVWHHRPYRLPVPADHAVAETVPAPGRRTVTSRRRALVLGGGSVLGLAGAGAGWWSWHGGSGGTGGPAEETAGGRAPDTLWRRSITTAPPADLGRPLLVGDLLVVTTDAGVTAVDTATGRTLWTANPVLSPWDVATDGKDLYAVDYSLSATEGMRIVRIAPEDGEPGDPLVDTKDYNGKLVRNQLLAVADDTAWVLTAPAPATDADTPEAVDPERGWVVASFSLTDGSRRSESPLGTARPEDYPWAVGARATDDRLILLLHNASGGLDVMAYDLATGRHVWRAPLALDADVAARSPLAVDSDHLYVSTDSLSAHRLSDGKVVWRHRGNGISSYGPAAVRGGTVYAVEGDGPSALVAVDAVTGRLRWREKSPDGSGHELKVAPTPGERYVYKHSAAGLRAIDLRTHESAWLLKRGLDRFAALIAGGLFIGCGEDVCAALPLDEPTGPATGSTPSR